MKKLLLSLATMALAASAASADTASWDFNKEDAYGFATQSGNSSVYETAITSLKEGDVTMSFTGNYRLWNYTSQSRYELRCMKGSTVTISVPEGATINSITFTGQTLFRFSFDENVVTASEENSGTNATFTCNGEKAIFTATDGRVDISTVTVEYTNVVIPDGKKPAGLAFSETNVVTYSKFATWPTLENPNNLPVTYTSSDENVIKVIDYGGGFIVTSLINFGTATVTATSEETDEFAAGRASYTVTYKPSANNIGQMLTYAPNNGDVVRVNCSVNVAYSNGNYLYIQDDYGNATLVYYSNASNNTYKIGDVIPGGWDATLSIYNGLLEWKATLPAPEVDTVTINHEPVETVTTDDINKVLLLKGVTFADATPTSGNFTGKLLDGSEIAFRNTFAIESVDAGQYDVVVAPAFYKSGLNEVDYEAEGGVLQLYPISYSEYVPDPEFPTTLDVTTSTEGAEVKSATLSYENGNGYSLNIDVETTTDEVELTVAIPEGWNEIYTLWFNDMQYDYGVGDDNPGVGDDFGFGGYDAPKKAIKWVTPDQIQQNTGFAPKLGNTFTLKADAEPQYGYLFLGRDGKLDETMINVVAVVNKTKIEVLPEEFPTEFTVTTPNANTEIDSKLIYDQNNTLVIDIKTASTDEVEFTIAYPEGFDALYTYWYSSEYGNGDIDYGNDIELLNAPRKALGWVSKSDPEFSGLLGMMKEGNTFTFKVNKNATFKDEAMAYLGAGDKVAANDGFNINLTITYDQNTGVEAIEAAEVEAEYFNLQGVKVTNPEAGIYVRVANGKAEKVVIK